MTTSANALPIAEATVRELSKAYGEPAWLLNRRLAAWRAYEAMAQPTGLEEEWRRTDLSGLDLEAALRVEASGALMPALSSTPSSPVRETRVVVPSGPHSRPRRGIPIGPIRVDPSSQASDVLLLESDGEATLPSERLPGGVVFTDLRTAAKKHAKLLEERLHRLVLPTEWKLQALAAALRENGVLIHVPRGIEVELPLHVLFSSLKTACFPHVLIVAEENSSVTVVQETHSPDELKAQLVSGAVEIYAGPYAKVRFYDIERWGVNVNSFTTLRARLDRGAELTTVTVGLGGKLSRSKIEARLEGEGAQADLLGVSYGDASQHFDYNTLQDHRAPRTRSDLLYKAALTDRASEVWNGTVRIHKGASLSDANQTSRNLLLSPTAKAAPIPVLEIEQYDILRCSHGATAGPVDEEQLFYLESRGIEPAEAERLLVEAFFQPVLDRIMDDPLRGRVQELLARKIEGGR